MSPNVRELTTLRRPYRRNVAQPEHRAERSEHGAERQLSVI